MKHTSRSVKRRVKRRASKSVKRKLRPLRSRKNAGHKSSNRVMRGGARFQWNREFDVSDQLPGQPAQTRPKVFKIEISEPLIGGGGKYNVELTVDLDQYTDWTVGDYEDIMKRCILKSDPENQKVKNYLHPDHVAVRSGNERRLNQWGNEWTNVTVKQRCGLDKKDAQYKETVYTLIDALAKVLFNKQIDSVDILRRNDKKQIVTKNDVMEGNLEKPGKTPRCVVKMSLVPDTKNQCVDFIVNEYTVISESSNWDTLPANRVIATYKGNPKEFFTSLNEKLAVFTDKFYQVVSAEGREYMGIFTFDAKIANEAAAAAARIKQEQDDWLKRLRPVAAAAAAE